MKTSRRLERVLSWLDRAQKELGDATSELACEVRDLRAATLRTLERARAHEAQISMFEMPEREAKRRETLARFARLCEESAPYVPWSETSWAAARTISSRAPNDRLKVLAGLIAFGPATDDTIARTLGLYIKTANARRNDLMEIGLVEDTGATAESDRGRPAVLWKASEDAMSVIIQAREVYREAVV